MLRFTEPWVTAVGAMADDESPVPTLTRYARLVKSHTSAINGFENGDSRKRSPRRCRDRPRQPHS